MALNTTFYSNRVWLAGQAVATMAGMIIKPVGPQRWTRILLCVALAAMFMGIVTIFVQSAREANDQDRRRAEARAGRVNPEDARDILSKEEFEKLDQAWSKRQTK